MRRAAVRTLLSAALAFVVGSAPAASEPRAGDPSESEVSFVRDGVRFRLRLRARRATLSHGWAGELGSYSVWKDGRFVHPEDWDGGRLVGCRYGDLGLTVEPFPDASAPVGWLLRTMAGCGSRSHRRYRLITVPQAYGRYADTYVETTFRTPGDPVVRREGDAIEIWADEERVDRGAVSLFTPFLIRVGPDLRPSRPPLDPAWTRWAPPYDAPSFAHAFVVGLDQRDAVLMRSALDVLFAPEVLPWCSTLGLPDTRDGLAALADAVARSAAAERQAADLLRAFPR